jgi:hypothetical protein
VKIERRTAYAVEARGAIVLDGTDRILENGCNTDGRRFAEDLTRTEIAAFYQDPV